MIVAFVVDGDGRPICSEMWPGNTADVNAVLPVIDRLRGRFAIGQVSIVADRGMIAAATIKGLEARGLEYVLGVRGRSDKIVREPVLKDEAPMAPLVIERGKGETQLFVKEVRAQGRRDIVCRNEQEAERTAPPAKRSSTTCTTSSNGATRRSSETRPTGADQPCRNRQQDGCYAAAPFKRVRSPWPASRPSTEMSSSRSSQWMP
jgi:hypothetical protein